MCHSLVGSALCGYVVIIQLCMYVNTQNEFVGSFKHAARREMSESDVNASMYVQFEANSNVISVARLAVGGVLSSAATAYNLTPLLSGRFIAMTVLLSFQYKYRVPMPPGKSWIF